jgi:hypothetical protein
VKLLRSLLLRVSRIFFLAVQIVANFRIYLGLYLQDLTFIEDGNLDVCPDNPHNLINFEKRLMAAKGIGAIQ